MKKFTYIAILTCVVFGLGSCAKRELNNKTSNTTGWDYFDEKTTNFEAQAFLGNVDPVGMVPIQGGTFTIGENDEFLTAPRDNMPRSITVSSFYMDKYEVSNLNWREYEHWMRVVFAQYADSTKDYSASTIEQEREVGEIMRSVLPDTLIWREEMAYNEPYLENYYRHPAFSFYPVVGVSWEQAMAYSQWRTDRVNEKALVAAGIAQWPNYRGLIPSMAEEDFIVNDEYGNEVPFNDYWDGQYELEEFEGVNPETGEEATFFRFPLNYVRERFIFNTEKYLVTDYDLIPGRHPVIDTYTGVRRKVTRADGILVPGYRLPTEAEWMFAAYAPIAGEDGLTIEGKLYPWSGYHPRDMISKNKGAMQANFVRGRGDMMGVSGALNDRYVITGPVDDFVPNDFGLYNMAGNVNEWVMDVYRETTNEATSEYNSFRGNIYTKAKKDESGHYVIDRLGCVEREIEGDKRDFKDGDKFSFIDTDYPLDTVGAQYHDENGALLSTIRFDVTDALAPRNDNEARVYKGGSWNDRVYWLNPTSRRFKNQKECSSTIGFRCAMSTVGNQIDNGSGLQ